MVSLTDAQLAAVMDAARPLPVEKLDVYLRRIAAIESLTAGEADRRRLNAAAARR